MRNIEYGIGNKYSLDLEILWKMLTEPPYNENEIILDEHKILYFDKTEKKYNLIDYYTEEKVCTDGEICEIIQENNAFLEVIGIDTQVLFKISRRNFEIAAY